MGGEKMPIVIFYGNLGSGKTLAMTREAYIMKQKGFKIKANYHLNFDYEHINNSDLKNYEQMDFNNCVILLDEIALIGMDSRNSQTKMNKIFSYFLIMSRKQKNYVYCSTQKLRLVDVRLRELASILVKCRKLKRKGKDIIILEKIFVDRELIKSEIIDNPEKYYNMYDTNEIIKYIETDKTQQNKKIVNDFLNKHKDNKQLIKCMKIDEMKKAGLL
jgi:hypothetical protein